MGSSLLHFLKKMPLSISLVVILHDLVICVLIDQLRLNFHRAMILWFIYRLDRSAFLFRFYVNKIVLKIVSEISFIYASISPHITTITAFFIILVSSNINISWFSGWSPSSLSMPAAIYEITFIRWSICPAIFAFAMEFTFLILSFIEVLIGKLFNPITLLNWFHKCSLIKLVIWEFQHSVSIAFTIFPLSTIVCASAGFKINASSILNSLNPLTIIDISVGTF